MSATLVSIDHTIVAASGGTLLTLAGEFPIGKALYLYIGPNGDATDTACWSGVPGQGRALYAVNNGGNVQAYTPALPPGGPYDLFLASPNDNDDCSLAAALTVLPSQHYSSTFALRSNLPPNYATGPRNLDQL